jgi:multidrug efflux pump subunit AcrA (membrane-fusion protein)
MTTRAKRLTAAPAAALLAIAFAALAGCRARQISDEDEAASAPAPVPVLLVTAARAETASITATLRVLGTTVALRHVIVRAPTAGRVLGVDVKAGDFVRKGQVVAHVLNREVEAAQAGLAVAQQLDPRDAAALARSVQHYSIGAGVAVVAPESGVVSSPPVTSGQMVADLDPIIDLVDPASIYVLAAVPVDSLHLIRRGMPATITSPLHPGAQFAARVAAVMPTFNPNSATAPVRIDFTASAGAIAETDAPVEAQIVTRDIPDAIVVPAAAMFQDLGENRYHVFVVGADGRAHRTPVTAGIRQGDRVQITGGLEPGAEVITSGGYALSDGLKVQVAGSQP